MKGGKYMGDEILNQVEKNNQLIEQCNETLDMISRTVKIMNEMVGDDE